MTYNNHKAVIDSTKLWPSFSFQLIYFLADPGIVSLAKGRTFLSALCLQIASSVLCMNLHDIQLKF